MDIITTIEELRTHMDDNPNGGFLTVISDSLFQQVIKESILENKEIMTTPQAILNNIEYKLSSLLKSFYQENENDECTTLFDTIQQIKLDIDAIKQAVRMQSDLMALILKVLNDK